MYNKHKSATIDMIKRHIRLKSKLIAILQVNMDLPTHTYLPVVLRLRRMVTSSCLTRRPRQWRSYRLRSQGGHGGLGDGVHGRSSGEGLESNNLQLSDAFLRRFVAESVLHLP